MPTLETIRESKQGAFWQPTMQLRWVEADDSNFKNSVKQSYFTMATISDFGKKHTNVLVIIEISQQ